MGVNLLCDKLGIKRKNQTININLDEIQQVTKTHFPFEQIIAKIVFFFGL